MSDSELLLLLLLLGLELSDSELLLLLLLVLLLLGSDSLSLDSELELDVLLRTAAAGGASSRATGSQGGCCCSAASKPSVRPASAGDGVAVAALMTSPGFGAASGAAAEPLTSLGTGHDPENWAAAQPEVAAPYVGGFAGACAS